jgi:hypothetical protein
MKRLHWLRPSPAMVVACLALGIALGGTSVAAIQALPKNSVGTRQLKKNAVISSKVKNRSLLAVDFKAGQLPAGPQGPAGPGGPAGPAGPAGQQGPSGSALAYAFVAANGTLDATRSKNVVSVTHPVTGFYCFDLAVTVNNAVASTNHIAGQFDGNAETEIRPETGTTVCAEPNRDAAVWTERGSTNALNDNAFMVVFN